MEKVEQATKKKYTPTEKAIAARKKGNRTGDAGNYKGVR